MESAPTLTNVCPSVLKARELTSSTLVEITQGYSDNVSINSPLDKSHNFVSPRLPLAKIGIVFTFLDPASWTTKVLIA